MVLQQPGIEVTRHSTEPKNCVVELGTASGGGLSNRGGMSPVVPSLPLKQSPFVGSEGYTGSLQGALDRRFSPVAEAAWVIGASY